MNSFSMKANRLSTRKKGSKTNHKGTLTVEPQKISNWEIGGGSYGCGGNRGGNRSFGSGSNRR